MDQADEVIDQAEVIDEQKGQEQQGETLVADGQEADQGEVVITIGEAPPEQQAEAAQAPQWVRDLRKADREKARLLREKDEEIAKLKGNAAPEPVAVGEKPTLAGCEYDEDEYDRKYSSWQQRKQAAEAKQREVDAAKEAETESWNAKIAAHNTAKAALKVGDYEDAEEVARGVFSVTQQGIIVSGADNSAIVIYALGKNPAKAKELAAIKDPVKFSFAVAKLEQQLKVTPRKTPPPPERTVQGNAPVSATDPKLAKLEAEADRTGDRSAVAAYRREQRAKA